MSGESRKEYSFKEALSISISRETAAGTPGHGDEYEKSSYPCVSLSVFVSVDALEREAHPNPDILSLSFCTF
jgi:hypothetical protein